MMSLLRRLLVRGAIITFQYFYGTRLISFETSLQDPERAQARTLETILKDMEATEFGRQHEISAAMSREEFRARVPIADYESLEPWIKRQTESRENILTPGSLVIFEKTSGSRGSSKWIPYNKSQLATFERMFTLWCLDLFRAGLRLDAGKVFFLISPKTTAPEAAPNGVSVGLKDDSGYLGSWVSMLSRLFFVDSSKISKKHGSFLHHLAVALVRERDLEVISMWSPSLLVLILEHIELERLELGRLSDLAIETRAALNSRDVGSVLHARLWPKMKMISAWDAAGAAEDALKIRANFLNTEFQGKGLLATEAAMTVPWRAANGFVPLVDDIYFEFENERDGAVYELHELETCGVYQIIVTAPNGFLRYRVGDRVRAAAPFLSTPTLEFIGRAGGVSDRVGEKLTPEFIEQALGELFESPRPFVLVTAVGEGRALRYLLAYDEMSIDEDELANRFEERLVSQHHYAHARSLGQLARAEAICLPDLRAIYFENRTRRGAQEGQIKIETLVTDVSFGLALDVAMRRPNRTSHQSRSDAVARL